MPVLGLETSVLPDDLFSSDIPFRSEDAHWWVLHTRPRAEKAVTRRLVQNEIPCFLPLYEHRYRQQRRLIQSMLPLFPSYVFTLATEEQRYSMLAVNQIANCLKVEDEEQFFNELKTIHQTILSGTQLTPESRLEPGMSAEIVSGPLKGHRGTVLRRSNSLRFVLEVNFLQSGASVEINNFDLKPL